MGSGHNPSVSVSNSARRKASNRTASSFWADVPVYQYELECTDVFRTRTPIPQAGYDEEQPEMWCELCQQYRALFSLEPLNQPVSNDEAIGLAQDVGIVKERIANAMQQIGFLSSEGDLERFYTKGTVQYGIGEDEIPVKELMAKYGISLVGLRKINMGLTAVEGLTLPELCPAGLHEMTLSNVYLTTERGTTRKRCRICYNAAKQERRVKSKKAGTRTHAIVTTEQVSA